MQDTGRLRPAAAATLAALTAVVIVYGSLYPFRFRGALDWRRAATDLLATADVLTSRGDLISNVLLYAPLGFFIAQALARLGYAAVPLAIAAGGLLSVTVELLQSDAAFRSSAMSDVYMNLAGSLVGALVGRLAPLARSARSAEHEPARSFAGLVLAAWLGWRLYPFVPALDWQKVKAALKPIVLASELPALDLFRHFAGWLAAAVLLEAIAGPHRRRLAFALLVAGVLAVRCLLVGVALTPAEVAGGGLALFAWLFGLAEVERRARVVVLLFAAAIALQSLEPFMLLPQPRPFVWVPFRSLIVGSTETNVRSFLEKTFLYGALLWLLLRGGARFWPAATGATAFVLALKWGQTWLPRRSGEITDVLLVLILALILRLTSAGPRDSAT